jgi:DNA-directed RNA polymerase subunit RPC12/RpoP
MLGNGNWVCFECREAVRRPTQHADDVPCPACGQKCKYLGTQIPVPPKRSVKAWRELQDWFNEAT